jgi:hypothetical protein
MVFWAEIFVFYSASLYTVLETNNVFGAVDVGLVIRVLVCYSPITSFRPRMLVAHSASLYTTLETNNVLGTGDVGLVVRVLVVLDLLAHVGDVQVSSLVTDIPIVQRLQEENK